MRYHSPTKTTESFVNNIQKSYMGHWTSMLNNKTQVFKPNGWGKSKHITCYGGRGINCHITLEKASKRKRNMQSTCAHATKTAKIWGNFQKKKRKKRRPGAKEGGRIPKAGLYRLHKGEVVVPAYKVKVVDAALKKAGKKPLKKVCKTCVLSKKQLNLRKKN